MLMEGFTSPEPGRDKRKFYWMDLRSMTRRRAAFTSRVNVDAVREVSVETGGFGAQYAHAGGGIISLDTQSGDDRLRFGVTNFIPDVSFQQGTHFGNLYPRADFFRPAQEGQSMVFGGNDPPAHVSVG